MRFTLKIPIEEDSIDLWVKELSDAFWDLIFVLIHSEDDVEGAKTVAIILRYFFPYEIYWRDVLEYLYALRGWERDLGVPFPYLLHAIHSYKRRHGRADPESILTKAKLLFYRRNPYLLRTKKEKGHAENELQEN